MSLYDRLASTPEGARGLAAARLRRTTLNRLWDAFEASGLSEKDLAKKAGMRVRRVRRILHGDGNVEPTTLATLLYAAGYEAEIRLVPAGELRRREIEGPIQSLTETD